ncbi:MAG: uracil-DNA glycosylase family protein, partial [Flavobacteriales bacterium]
LNATLTVRKSNAGSHQKKGWEQFTDAAIEKLSNERENLVFILWGKYAQNKETLVNPENGHLVLKAPHPSPFSAHKGFLGCKHFSKTNAFLSEKGISPIDWNLNEQ